MPLMDKSKLLAFAKKTAAPPPAAKLLALKRTQPALPPVEGAPENPPMMEGAGMESDMDESPVFIHELVEEAAQEAEAGQDLELEDAIAGTTSQSSEDVPAWATDADKWAEAAEEVGLGNGGEDLYEEPYVVAAYLYKKMGGEVKGIELPETPGMEDEGETDVTKPGAAAKALAAVASVRAAKQLG